LERLTPQDYFIFFLEKRSKKNAHISYLLGFTDGTRRPKVSSQIYEREFATLIFCLRHRCTKTQSFGETNSRLSGSKTLQVFPPIFFLRKNTRGRFTPPEPYGSLNRNVQRNFLLHKKLCARLILVISIPHPKAVLNDNLIS